MPKSAFSARCPRCTRYLAFRDMTVQQKLEGDLTTMGHVVVEPDSEMSGKLVCGQFTNEGRFEGTATVYGPAVLGGGSLTSGRIHASSLRIVSTATARLRVRIGSMTERRPTAHIEAKRPLPSRSIRLNQSLMATQ
ncbi:MAG: polymer-forming cytoskeletal protein [Rhodospirillales bacterium]|nr:polymer-forming cytoskeletal protein [Rhodospirillales bacterium]